MQNEMIASANSQTGAIAIWNFDTNSDKWHEDAGSEIEQTFKRQKTGVATVDPTLVLKTTAPGIPALKWILPDTLLATGADHQLKVFDTNKQ